MTARLLLQLRARALAREAFRAAGRGRRYANATVSSLLSPHSLTATEGGEGPEEGEQGRNRKEEVPRFHSHRAPIRRRRRCSHSCGINSHSHLICELGLEREIETLC